jgi:sec-independent protein translocase protein TatC
VATPSTDPFTMIAMALPMVLLFELAVLWCFLHDRRRARRQLAASAEMLPDDVPSAVDPLPERLDRPTQWTDLP